MIRPIKPTASTKQSNSISGEPVVIAVRPRGHEVRITPVTVGMCPPREGFALSVFPGDSVWFHADEVRPIRDMLNQILGEDPSQEPEVAVKPSTYRLLLEAIHKGATSTATVAKRIYPGQGNGSNNVRALVSKARKSGHLHEGNPLRLTPEGEATLDLLPAPGGD